MEGGLHDWQKGLFVFSKDRFMYDNILKGKWKKGEVYGVKPQIHRISFYNTNYQIFIDPSESRAFFHLLNKKFLFLL